LSDITTFITLASVFYSLIFMCSPYFQLKGLGYRNVPIPVDPLLQKIKEEINNKKRDSE